MPPVIHKYNSHFIILNNIYNQGLHHHGTTRNKVYMVLHYCHIWHGKNSYFQVLYNQNRTIPAVPIGEISKIKNILYLPQEGKIWLYSFFLITLSLLYLMYFCSSLLFLPLLPVHFLLDFQLFNILFAKSCIFFAFLFFFVFF